MNRRLLLATSAIGFFALMNPDAAARMWLEPYTVYRREDREPVFYTNDEATEVLDPKTGKMVPAPWFVRQLWP
jgi:hypothetical protein